MTGAVLIMMTKCQLRSIFYSIVKCFVFSKSLCWQNVVKVGQPCCLIQVENPAHDCSTPAYWNPCCSGSLVASHKYWKRVMMLVWNLVGNSLKEGSSGIGQQHISHALWFPFPKNSVLKSNSNQFLKHMIKNEEFYLYVSILCRSCA